MKKLALLTLFVICAQTGFAQSTKVAAYLKLAAQGKIEEVKSKLPELVSKYPDEPGVKLIQAVIMDDGLKAVEIYKKIVKEYPNSEWADDAQWRVVQFYSIIGDTTNAKFELDKFRRVYPNSEFLAPASDAVKVSIADAKHDYAAKTVKKNEPAKDDKKHTAKNEKLAPEEEKFGLQVGIYTTKSAAESEKKRFMAMKLRTEVKEKKLENEIKYAVVIGDYSSKESAEKAKNEVEKKCGCTPLIYKK
eukprot:TRINITY_DN10396_c0_g1_i2.p1 TRINITY_DN10396_c0_g1~~TRINITY_DN10396_c0_g1_i2.p1  ORF type:complete len:247 (-),score=16.14 TRINITY_DN10396_c0_g1_i2:170-910(-)